MSASPIAAFKARVRTEVTLPYSRLVVEIGILDCFAFVGLGELPMPVSEPEAHSNGTAPGASASAMAVNLRLLDRAIAMAAINPPFSDRPEDRDRQDLVHVQDLTYDDRVFLGKAITEWAGLNRDLAAAVQSFRPDALGQAGESPGGEISQATERDPGADTGTAVPGPVSHLPPAGVLSPAAAPTGAG
jgi:hypothetical protein